MGSGNFKDKDDYKDMALKYIETGRNMSQTLRDLGLNPTNGNRYKTNPAFLEALAEVEYEISKETGVTQEFIVAKVNSVISRLSKSTYARNVSEEVALAKAQLDGIKIIVDVCGLKAPTQHNRLTATASIPQSKILADAVNRANQELGIKEIPVNQEV